MEHVSNLMQDKKEIPLRMNNFKNNFYSQCPKKYKNNYKGNKNHLNTKRNNKNKMRYKIPETPHNTGQYLSHIHQESLNKKKASQLNNNIDINDRGNNAQMDDFIDNDDDNDDMGDLNLDFQFIQDKDRDKLISLEGKNLYDFLFNEKGNEKDKYSNDNPNDNIKRG